MAVELFLLSFLSNKKAGTNSTTLFGSRPNNSLPKEYQINKRFLALQSPNFETLIKQQSKEILAFFHIFRKALVKLFLNFFYVIKASALCKSLFC